KYRIFGGRRRCGSGVSRPPVHGLPGYQRRNRIGTWTLVEPSAFPDATVWSDYGMGYLFIPVLLPVTAMYWLRRARTDV
ncbi:hypothetical protein ABZS63_42525, partial [Streptomyces sp. NPDC005568]